MCSIWNGCFGVVVFLCVFCVWFFWLVSFSFRWCFVVVVLFCFCFVFSKFRVCFSCCKCKWIKTCNSCFVACNTGGVYVAYLVFTRMPGESYRR